METLTPELKIELLETMTGTLDAIAREAESKARSVMAVDDRSRAAIEDMSEPEATATGEIIVRNQQSTAAGALLQTALGFLNDTESIYGDEVMEGSLVAIDGRGEDEPRYYLIATAGGGKTFTLSDGKTITCVSPNTPLGEGIMGLSVGDQMVYNDGVSGEITEVI